MEDQQKPVEEQPVQPQVTEPQVLSKSSEKSKHSALIAIITALLVALALIVLGYLTYTASNNEDADDDQLPKNESVVEDETGPADEEDVDNLDAEFDATFDELEATDDFNEDDLSDESLAL